MEPWEYEEANANFKKLSEVIAGTLDAALPDIRKGVTQAEFAYLQESDRNVLEGLQKSIRSEELSLELEPVLEKARREWRKKNPDKIKG
jgi:hypothetical protein